MMKYFFRLFLSAFFALPLPLSAVANAADKNGQYMVGGGVGGLTCAHFLDTMATARQEGGAHSIDGANLLKRCLGGRTGQNAIDRRAVNAEPAGDLIGPHSLGLELSDLGRLGARRRLAALVLALGLGLGDPFPLALKHHLALELRH
jgi:hypothetical protein